MNPPGEWIFKNMTWQFCNHSIMAVYGKVFPIHRKSYGLMWMWTVGVGLEARLSADAPIEGFAYTEDEAKLIVECILKNTRTCKFEEVK